MRAAMVHETGGEVVEVVEDLETIDIGPREVRVSIRASSLCHTDLRAVKRYPKVRLPAVIGHEGAGTISEVGNAVAGIRVGDPVIVAMVPPCGHCAACLRPQPYLCRTVQDVRAIPRFRRQGQAVYGFLGAGTFAEEIVVPDHSVVVIPDDVPFAAAALVGCGVMTGAGAVLNDAHLRPGQSVIIFGCGAVGVSAIQAARLVGAHPIVAVDLSDVALATALKMGASHVTDPAGVLDIMAELTEGVGFDCAVEAVGSSQTIRGAWDVTRRGGTVLVTGVGGDDEMVEFSAKELQYGAKTLRGDIYGASDVRRDFNIVLQLWRSGHLDLEGMVARRIRLEELNDAIEMLEHGGLLRQVVEFDAT